ncbi:LOW QUALITY PROTEIN: uncharacterized protein EMH_0018780 [Eimeria mitis]|uniref:Uncharacterized protein n=1 Tax=Eimeria mitis TaxID=44415 RepID=U6KEY4_9EIME|nr:LOW QUALITY PROTEIN: uncharacterized protein EMH_0018780 [Eimeria mitis]CDJ36499.1 hypothetical protein EMH_0018780 [Eimeria mitis]
MQMFVPLFAASVALLAEAADVEVPAAPVLSTDVGFSQAELPSKSGRRGTPLLVLTFLATAVAVVFLVLRCFTAIQANGDWSIYRRRLAEGGPDPCPGGVTYLGITLRWPFYGVSYRFPRKEDICVIRGATRKGAAQPAVHLGINTEMGLQAQLVKALHNLLCILAYPVVGVLVA